MTREEIFARFSEVFSDTMDLDDPELSDSTTADDFYEWDSLSHVRLIVALERSFGIKFSNSEIESFKRVGDLIDAIKAKLG